MKAKGVKFEDIDMPGIKTVNGVAEFGPIKSAWFKDTEGNILGIANMKGLVTALGPINVLLPIH